MGGWGRARSMMKTGWNNEMSGCLTYVRDEVSWCVVRQEWSSSSRNNNNLFV
jgi:hypothetical protein